MIEFKFAWVPETFDFGSTTFGSISSSTSFRALRVAADGSHTVRLLPHYVERVSHIGLGVTPDGAAWLTHRRFGADGSFDHGWVSRLAGSSWSHHELGRLAHPYELVPSAPHLAHTVTRLSDGGVRLVRTG
jgi:hypothetical protein